MANFQGGGFQLDLPEDVVDASSYVFVKDDGSVTPPILRVTSHMVEEMPEDIDIWVAQRIQTEKEASAILELLEASSNKRNNWLYGVATVVWGGEPGALKERRVYLFVDEKPVRFFNLSITAPTPIFAESVAYFAGAIRSFLPNDVQKLVPDTTP